MTNPPLVKICGITNLEDAALAANAGAEFLGLNFFPESPRFLESAAATKLASEIKNKLPNIKLVGVFVNERPEQINKLAKLCELDILQFHGEETPDFCEKFDLPIWRAFRVKNHESLSDVQQFLHLAGIVLDAYKKGAIGGTGQTFDWELIHRVRDELPYFILSGGINLHNVSKAIKQLRPNVIDVCSGAEDHNNKRKKDPQKIKDLFEAIRSAE